MQRRLDKQKKLFSQLGIHLDALSIHEKVFSNKLRGYDPDEVDSFLDEVIKDYKKLIENYQMNIELLQKTITSLQQGGFDTDEVTEE